MIRSYELVVHGDAVDVLCKLPPREQDRSRDFFDWLVRNPGVAGAHFRVDSAGRRIDGHILGPYLIAVWPDHAAREIRVVDVIVD